MMVVRFTRNERIIFPVVSYHRFWKCLFVLPGFGEKITAMAGIGFYDCINRKAGKGQMLRHLSQ